MNSILSNIDNDKLGSAIKSMKNHKTYISCRFNMNANILTFGYNQYTWNEKKRKYIEDIQILVFDDANTIEVTLEDLISLNRKNKIENILNSEK